MPQLKLLELVVSCGELWRVVAGCGELWRVVVCANQRGVHKLVYLLDVIDIDLCAHDVRHEPMQSRSGQSLQE